MEALAEADFLIGFDILREAAATLSARLPELVLLGVAAFVISALLMPLGTLRWWSRTGFQEVVPALEASPAMAAPAAADSDREDDAHYVVYLPGVDQFGDEVPSRREAVFLARIAAIPGVRVVDQVFAYDIDSTSLATEPRLGRVWGWLHRQTRGRTVAAPLGRLVSLRNLLQVMVALDPRYSPIYGFGVARLVLKELAGAGYRPGGAAPVTLLGLSGGAQIGLSVAGYLGPVLAGPLQMISLGGVITDGPGIDHLRRLVHLYGTHDLTQRLGALISPGRWPLGIESSWKRAVAEGRLIQIQIGPMRHTGRRGYLDPHARLPDGTSYLDRTLSVIEAWLTTPPGVASGRPSPAGDAKAK